ncbi:MAG: hypothetical protein K1X67_10360 [Fimbriimonadaceae bacterium]|nr:hypothetical protein [Fimbriimonadaceae bacterium]
MLAVYVNYPNPHFIAGAHSGSPTGSVLGAAVGLAVGGALEISQVRVTAREQLSPAYRSKLGYIFAASEEGLT